MNDDEKVMLVECDQRSKSAICQIKEIKEDLKTVKEDQKLMYDLTTSVKVISENLIGMKDDLKEVKQGQTILSNKLDNQIQEIKTDVDTKVGHVNAKVDKIEREPYETYKKDKHDIKLNVIKQVIGYFVVGIVAIIGTLIGSGTIKL